MKKIEEKINLISEEIKKVEKEAVKESLIVEMKKIGIERLPYSYSALKKFIDAETMNFHYNKHYKGYVEKLNDALSKKKYGDLELEEIIKSISRFDKTIRNNAGGAFNHALFWKMLSPKTQNPGGEVLKQIKKDFKTYTTFKNKFEEVAKERFGSGWVWLVLTKRNKLKIVSTPNQDNPLMNVVEDGGYPLLGLDLWEHAYYLRYQNKKEEYIGKFFTVINWDFVNTLLTSKNEKKINEEKLAGELLVETKESLGCSTTEVREINKMFAMNKQVKYKFMNTINSIMKEKFSEYWFEKGQYEPDSMSGIYNYGKPGRSVINKLNTNYSSFCILMSDLNVYLIKNKIPPISFTGKDEFAQIKEVERFSKYLYDLRDRIFNLSTSKTFQNIVQKLVQTDAKGDEREDSTVIALRKIFGTEDVHKIGGLGSEEDMISGVDAIINKDGKRLTAQIKPFSGVKDFDDDSVMVFGASAPKQYKTDYLVFNNKNKTIVFKNENTKIIDGNYVFPKSNIFADI